MPKKIYATPDYRDNLEVPRPGENVDAGDVNAPFQDLLNNSAWLRQQVSELWKRLETQAVAASAFLLSTLTEMALEPDRTYTLADAIGIARAPGYDGNIDLQAIDLPAGVAMVFVPDPATGDRASLTITTGVQLVPGLYNVIIRGTGPDGRTADVRIRLEVAAQTQQATFSATTQADASIDRASGQATTTIPINIRRAGLFAQPINLVVTNLPAGLNAQFSTNPVSGNAAVQDSASILTLTAAPSLPSGTYSLNLRLDGGGIVRTLAVALTVTAPAAAGGQPDFYGELVYDAGDPAVVNGATLYLNRVGGFTGPIRVAVVPAWDGNIPGPAVLVDGQSFEATIVANSCRLTAEGASTGWTGSGVAEVARDGVFTGSYAGNHATHGVRLTATINGQVVTRYVSVVVRAGTRTY